MNEVLMKAGKDWEKRQGDKISLPELVEKIASHLDLKTEKIISASRRKEISEDRALICHFAINNLSYSAIVAFSIFSPHPNVGAKLTPICGAASHQKSLNLFAEHCHTETTELLAA